MSVEVKVGVEVEVDVEVEVEVIEVVEVVEVVEVAAAAVQVREVCHMDIKDKDEENLLFKKIEYLLPLHWLLATNHQHQSEA